MTQPGVAMYTSGHAKTPMHDRSYRLKLLAKTALTMKIMLLHHVHAFIFFPSFSCMFCTFFRGMQHNLQVLSGKRWRYNCITNTSNFAQHCMCFEQIWGVKQMTHLSSDALLHFCWLVLFFITSFVVNHTDLCILLLDLKLLSVSRRREFFFLFFGCCTRKPGAHKPD